MKAETNGVKHPNTQRIPVELSPRMKMLPPYLFGRLNAAKYQKRRAGIDVIDLGMGNPNDPTPQPIVDKICEAVRDPRNHRYSQAAGLLNLRKEVAKQYKKRYDVKLDPETEIVCVIGSKEGLSHLCLALLGAGDSVVVPEPAFPVHIFGPALAGANVITVQLTEGEALLRSIHDVIAHQHPRPKAIILNYPHNPTGATVDLDFFERVVAFAQEHQILILHDFAYCDIVFDGYTAPSFLQVPGAKEVGIEFTTMSKSYNMAGWRCGFCVGHRDVVTALSQVKGYYDYGLFQPVQIAAIIAMRECEKHVKEQARVYQGRRDVLCDGLERIGWPVERPRASMFVWTPIPEKYRAMGSIDFAFEMIEKAEVAVAPGRGFGEGGEGYLRLALVENELRLKQAVRQIGRAFPG
ncbi:MAG: aminotransferase class I/II-fold pyridoxal phosphate-dependent enzyme [Planctomycetota bacterium]